MKSSGKWQPTTREAAWWLAVAAAFIGFTWWENGWMIRRGDYPAPYLKHTWYWNGRAVLALAVFAVSTLLIWRKARRNRHGE
jgi:hypothetical protein